MKRIAIYSAAAAVAFAGSGLMGLGTQASATTEHCDSTTFPNKVEVDAGTKVQTNLEPGTVVCIKAGTKTTIVNVDGAGFITQDTIKNKPGNAFLGISYYAYGEGREECPSGGC